jgi:hypothetical protein
MLGNKFGFYWFDVLSLLNLINTRLEEYYTRYDITDQSIIYYIATFNKLDVKFYSEFKLDKPDYVDNSLHKQVLASTNIPVSINEVYLGKSLTTYKDKGYITNVVFSISISKNGMYVNFLDSIKNTLKRVIKISFDDGYYLESKSTIIAIKKI